MKEYGSNFEMPRVAGEGNGKELKNSGNTFYLRCAREAFYLIGKNESERGVKTVFMPSLCCKSMVQSFEQLCFDVKYYRLTDELKIDYSYLESILEDNSLLVVINYHGINSFNADMIKKIIGERNVKVIQDCTQHIFTDSMYDSADYRVGSIRKWVSIPDGAFLTVLTEPGLKAELIREDDDPFVLQSLEAMREKSEYLSTGNAELKKKYRSKNAFCMDYLKGKVKPHGISKSAVKIYRDDINTESVIKKRRENYTYLKNSLSEMNSGLLKYAKEQYCPLCLPIVTDNRNEVQKRLAEKNVFCQVLWPVPAQAGDICENSLWFSEHMLAVPCDQRYSIEDMKYISSAIKEVLSE